MQNEQADGHYGPNAVALRPAMATEPHFFHTASLSPVHVHKLAVRPPIQDLGRRIELCADVGREFKTGIAADATRVVESVSRRGHDVGRGTGDLQQAARAQISNLHNPARGHEQVAGLEIAMHETVGMEVLHAFCCVAAETDALCPGQLFAALYSE